MNIKHLWLAVAMSSLAQPSRAQENEPPFPLSDAPAALISYENCVMTQVGRYASVKEAPSEVVDAAFAFCSKERGWLRRAYGLADLQKNGTFSPPERAEASVAAAELTLRRAAVRAIFNARYPSAK